MRINLMKAIFYIDGIKGLHANCRLVSCFVSYANEHQSNYHGITWFKFLVLLVLWILLTKAANFLCLLSCLSTSCWTNSGYESESKIHESQIMLLLSRVYTSCARMRAYTSAYADCRRSCLYFCRRLRPANTRAYVDCRRQSSNLLNFQGQRRPAQAFQPITKALQGHRGLTRCSDRDVCGRIPTHTLACLYFYPRRNLRYAGATHRQPQAWRSAPAAGAYARMEYKPGFM